MEKPVKNVYRIVDQNTNNVAHVVAESQSAAVAFLGLTQVLSVAEVAHAVEIVGTDSNGTYDQSISYSMLYCTGCGETKEVVAVDHIYVSTRLTEISDDL